MTFAEAMTEAKRRWGNRAVIQEVRTVRPGDGEGRLDYFVGEADSDCSWNVMGQGRSFEEAFAGTLAPRRRKR